MAQMIKNPMAQYVLTNFSDMSLAEMEHFIRELNVLAVQKRRSDKNKRDKFLLHKINQSILPEEVMQRYILLQEKMELGTLSIEYDELLKLVSQEEKIRNKRFEYLLELSQLRGVSLADLMNQLGLNVLNYA